jgi:3-dehydroquinate synthase
MTTVEVNLAGGASYTAHIGPDLLDRLGRLAVDCGLRPSRAAVVTDSNVGPLYAARLQRSLATAGFEPVGIEIAAGEPSKSLQVLESVYDRLVAARLDRGSPVFALGGGVVGDLAGFAAATYLRGVPLVEVPTSLIAQVDSALGGKTGVNHPQGKNLIGAFYQPRLVAADITTLATLPEREFREGLAEVIKCAAIADAPLVDWLETHMAEILARRGETLEATVARALAHKAAVVGADEREAGPRKILNFGHTVGHALEASQGYGTYLHGEAVAIGMAVALRLSGVYANLDPGQASRLLRLIEAAGLPTRMPAEVSPKRLLDALALDKKRAGQAIDFILIDRMGHATVKPLKMPDIVAALG